MAGTLPRRPESPAGEGLRSLRRWYAVLLAGGTLGIVTAAWQTVDRIAWAANPHAGSVCEINKVLSCSSVFSHWQSSALGIPNSLVALPVFGVLAATGLAGLLGSVLARGYLATILAVNVGFALFITWYLEQSAFALGILCLFCLGCGVSAVVSGVGLTRAAAEHAGHRPHRPRAQAPGRGRHGRDRLGGPGPGVGDDAGRRSGVLSAPARCRAARAAQCAACSSADTAPA